MARKKKEAQAEGMPAWLVTFSDLMTLLLTFFVLLLSMATIEERRKLEALGSLASAFESDNSKLFNPKSNVSQPTKAAPGVISPGAGEADDLRDAVYDFHDQDVSFQSNKVVSIISISNEVLFAPGSAVLTPRGQAVLGRLYPHLQQLGYPMLFAGHSSLRRDEEGRGYRANFTEEEADSTWMTSYARSLAVYQYYIGLGLSPSRLSIEAFGQFRPRFSNNTPEGRAKNRRVDIVIDTRDAVAAKRVERERQPERLPDSYYFNEFKFDLSGPKGRPGQTPVRTF